ncbi:MAG: RES family NAD+ phosphorylase [Ginsengibacter sp.]
MTVYRIANEAYKSDISGNGAALYGARWNSTGKRMLYVSEFISLCILESLVHFDRTFIPGEQYLIYISIPDSKNIQSVDAGRIKKDWRENAELTRWMGDQFIQANESIALKVPSAVVEQEYNFIINPLHPDFKKIKIIQTELLHLDKRLFVQKTLPSRHRI